MNSLKLVESKKELCIYDLAKDLEDLNAFDDTFTGNGKEIDEKDKKSPDNWIARHKNLKRLTGKHPFNCEPPLVELMTQGFLTSKSLHYVRNHGAVPKIDRKNHRLTLSGLGEKLEFSMDQIEVFPSRTLPVLLVCAGNRRREQNNIKQTIGFNWSPAGLSNSVWEGVLLRDLLIYYGVSDTSKFKYVWFEGADQLPNGSYGTGISLVTALDPSCDVLIAYKMNGKYLPPDHGFPLRVIIPGYIGGRMVKWLTKIHLSDIESTNHYHYFDNRVLPSHVDAEIATTAGWWYKPEYLINQLNINSAIYQPHYDEEVNTLASKSMIIKGYAYTGGGRKIIRVELTFNNGKSWKLCKIHYQKPSNQYEKYWCWFLWEYELYWRDFEAYNCEEICVRAWDTSMNTQPEYPTWNVMGMMNNPWYRLQIWKVEGSSNLLKVTNSNYSSRTLPEKKKAKLSISSEETGSSSEDELTNNTFPKKSFTMSEVMLHNTEADCWFVCNNLVYDVTPFLKLHPGGASSIMMEAGGDCTEDFEAIHSTKARKMLKEYCIGYLDTSKGIHEKSISRMSKNSNFPVVALTGKKIQIKLVKKTCPTHDTLKLVFIFHDPTIRLGLPVGQHVFLYANINGNLVVRPYTPISKPSDLGFIELIIKVYFKDSHPAFPDGGLMSQYLNSIEIGQILHVKGPLGHFEYIKSGSFLLDNVRHTSKKICMIAGGTGITPIYQVLRKICEDEHDTTEICLIYANKSKEDVLLFSELNDLNQHPQCSIWFTVDKAPTNECWNFDEGYISREMIERQFGTNAEYILMCGPPPMIKFACIPNLDSLGYKEDQYVLL